MERKAAQHLRDGELVRGIEDCPSQKVWPITLEEWAGLTVARAYRPCANDRMLPVETDQDLLGPVFDALRQEPELARVALSARAERACLRGRISRGPRGSPLRS